MAVVWKVLELLRDGASLKVGHKRTETGFITYAANLVDLTHKP